MLPDETQFPICPLCDREIPPDVPQNIHHLIPKLKGGKGGPTVLLHVLCHKEIHASLSEVELSRSYYSIELLKQHPRLQKFIKWVQRRPPEYNSRSPSLRKRRKRKS